jgi:hypothetical protein
VGVVNLTDEQIDAALAALAQHTRLPYGFRALGLDVIRGVVRLDSRDDAVERNRSAMRRVIAAALGDSTEPPPRDSTEPVSLEVAERAHAPGQCGRVLIGQGGDTWDPVCWLGEGHDGACLPHPDLLRAPRAR